MMYSIHHNSFSLLNDEAKIARAAINKHVQKITLTLEGRSYVVSGDWDLLGVENVATRMVPGARIARWRPLSASARDWRRSTR